MDFSLQVSNLILQSTNNSAIVKKDAISAYNVQDSYPYYVDVYGNLSKVTTADGSKLEGNLSYAFGEYQEHATAFNTKTGIKEIIATGIDGAPHYTNGVPDGTKMLRVFNTDTTHKHTLVTIPAVTGCDYNLSEGSYCSECGAIVTAQVATEGTGSHQWKLTNTVDPAVDKEGYKTYTCSVCHVEKVESIPATAVARIVDPETKEVTNYDKVEDAVKAAAGQVGGSGKTDVTVNLVPGYSLPEGTESNGTTIDKDNGTIKVTDSNATITIPKVDHSFSDKWSYDEAKHWHACTISGHSDKQDEGPHTGGTATCSAKAICEVCSQPYGSFAAHSLTKTEAKAATYTETGNHEYYTCETCGKVFKDAAGTQKTTVEAETIAKLTRPSSGGSSSSDRNYAVSAPSTKNGDVTVSPKNASKGDRVTVTVTPDKGYELDKLTVKDASGNKLKLTDKGNGKYTFTMPGSKVTVSAEFVEEQAASIFADVPADAYYAKAVEWAVKKGITNGKANGLFGSNDPCTRGQIVTFLWRAAGSPAPKGTAKVPADVLPGSYCYDAVAWALENGITNGLADGTFGVNNTCTRGQSVTFLYRAMGTAPTTVNGFTDVAAGDFYAEAVAWAVENGVTNGTSASTFSPNAGCTRAQIVTFLFRTYQGK